MQALTQNQPERRYDFLTENHHRIIKGGEDEQRSSPAITAAIATSAAV
jgi:hypothetical protein